MPGRTPADAAHAAAADDDGVQFPLAADGRRRTGPAGRQVLAAAVRGRDAALARTIASAADWRRRYGTLLLEVEALAVRSGAAATDIAADGLTALHDTFRFRRAGEETTCRAAMRRWRQPRLRTGEVRGQGERRTALEIPWHGEVLAGAPLRRQIDAWAREGLVEASAAAALHRLAEHPQWLDLRDLNVALLGAGAELAPAAALGAFGANVIAVDLHRREIWTRLLHAARRGAGRLTFPLQHACVPSAGDVDLAAAAGCDLLTMAPEVRTWLAELDVPLCIGAYAYRPGQHHLRLAVAMDAVMEDLAAGRADVALAFLLTPTDVFAVPGEVACAARANYAAAGIAGGWRRPLRALTGGRLYAPNAARSSVTPDGRRYALYDGILTAQGANYALAKRVQKWRALTARRDGRRVCANVAPATATASVRARPAFAAAFAGAAHYGAQVFDPATTNALMAALLVHDLRAPHGAADPATVLDHPLELFTAQAAHGGLWRMGYRPGSVIELAAVHGVFARRGASHQP